MVVDIGGRFGVIEGLSEDRVCVERGNGGDRREAGVEGVRFWSFGVFDVGGRWEKFLGFAFLGDVLLVVFREFLYIVF